jgi:hypothetical protein
MPLIAGGFAALLYALLHLKGIGIDSDGWAYWQGAGSLLAGHGYTYFSGAPIVAWPPLYSLYLAAWSSVFGLTGTTLILANGALVILQAWLWSAVVFAIWGDVSLIVAIFIGWFVALNNQIVLAGTLQYVILPLLILATWEIRASPRLGWVIVAIAAATGLMLSHTSSAVFLAASAVLIASKPKAANLAVAVCVICIPMAAWYLVRHALGQHNSHSIGFGEGAFGPVAYARQAIQGTGTLIVPQALGELCVLALGGAAVFLARRSSPPDRQALLFGWALSLMATLGLYAQFNVTFIHNELSDRFLLFFPLLGLSLLFLSAWKYWLPGFVVLVVMIVPPLAYRSTQAIAHNYDQDLSPIAFPRGFITPAAEISREQVDGPPTRTSRGIRISPPIFVEAVGRGT